MTTAPPMTPITICARATSPELLAALDRAKNHVMTPQEIFEQRVSFVYGQQDWSVPVQRTKDQIREHMIEIYGTPPAAAINEGRG